jgi:hypothetical protein
MKKLFILSFVTLASVVSLASCTKNYTCTCTTSYSGGTSQTSSVTIHDTYTKAKKSCENNDSSDTNTGTVKTCSVQ